MTYVASSRANSVWRNSFVYSPGNDQPKYEATINLSRTAGGLSSLFNRSREFRRAWYPIFGRDKDDDGDMAMQKTWEIRYIEDTTTADKSDDAGKKGSTKTTRGFFLGAQGPAYPHIANFQGAQNINKNMRSKNRVCFHK